jgi:hypothetical protein
MELSEAGNRLIYTEPDMHVVVEVLQDPEDPDVLLYVARRGGAVAMKAHRKGRRLRIHNCTDRTPMRPMKYYQAEAMTELPTEPRLGVRAIDDLRNNNRVYLTFVGKSGGIAIDVVDA